MKIRRWIGQGIAGLLLFGAASEAGACVYTASVETLGKPLTPRQERAEARAREKRIEAATRAETLRRLQQSDLRLRNGPVNFAGELAQLLVPNVRPVWISRSDCQHESEDDHGEGRETEETLIARFLGDTPYSGSGVSLRWLAVRGHTFSFGTECNAEFRGRFAAALGTAVSKDHLRGAWRFLGARLRPSFVSGGITGMGNNYEHLVAFRGRSRVPPVDWVLSHPILFEEVTGYVRRAAAGRAIAAAAGHFWNENAPSLGDDRRVCPATMARLDTARADIQVLLAKEWPRAKD